jgi:iron complex transport system permease protein
LPQYPAHLKSKHRFFLILFLCIAFAGIFLFSARYGTVTIAAEDFFAALFLQDYKNLAGTLIWEIRIPRFFAALICGGSLAICGQLLQLLVRNPLAEPYTLGTGSGAALALQLAVLGFLPPFLMTAFLLPLYAFFGAFLAGLAVLLIAGKSSQSQGEQILLAGIGISILSGSMISFLTFFYSEGNQMKQLAFWAFGSLDRSSWKLLMPVGLVLSPAVFLALQGGRRWNLMLLGDEKAASLGHKPAAIRRQILLLTSFMTACVVCLAGPVGFVGLLVPFFTRKIIPLGQNGQLSFTFLAGAAFLSFCDLLPRLLPGEIPLPAGLISSLMGLPLFLYLLRKPDGRKEKMD